MAVMLSDKAQPEEPEDLRNVQPGYLGTTPPLGPPPTKGERRWIDRPDQLLQAIQVLEQSSVIAIDAEFTQVRSFTPRAGTTSAPTSISSNRLALLQLAIDHYCFIVDAWRLGDLSPLASVTANPGITILLHGAGADIQVMAERGLSVVHYCDLEAASRSIFGQHESSLAAMLQRAFNVRLDKSLQRTDWTRRPLPTAMVSYAARDAEMTLALYYWIDEHYRWALQLHEHTDQQESVPTWMEPFLRGTLPVPTEVAISEASGIQGLLSEEELYADCRTALATLAQPTRRNRLLRLIADLSLMQLAPEIEPLLHAQASEERAAAARTLGRLHVPRAEELIRPLLRDPVYEVRKAAQTALRNLNSQTQRQQPQRLAPTRLADGVRSWTVGETSGTASDEDESEWKARLRAIMDE
jgi:hypothetical protein